MLSVISENGLGNSEPQDNMVEQKLRHGVTVFRKCRHRLDPFREIINSNDDVPMPPGRARVTGHIIDAPFGKSTDGYNGVQWRRGCTHLSLVNLALMT